MKFCKILAPKEKWRIYNNDGLVVTFMQRELGLVVRKNVYLFDDKPNIKRVAVEILLIWKRVVIYF